MAEKKKVILLNRADLALRTFTVERKGNHRDSKYCIEAVKVTDEQIEAIDSQILVTVPTTHSDEFPLIDGDGEPLGDDEVMVHRDSLAEAEKRVPKGDPEKVLPNASLTVKELPKGEKEACLATTDLETTTLIRGREVTRPWPDTEIMWGRKPSGCTVALQVAPMKKLLDYAAKHGNDSFVTFIFPDQKGDAATFKLVLKDGRTMRGVLYIPPVEE